MKNSTLHPRLFRLWLITRLRRCTSGRLDPSNDSFRLLCSASYPTRLARRHSADWCCLGAVRRFQCAFELMNRKIHVCADLCWSRGAVQKVKRRIEKIARLEQHVLQASFVFQACPH